MTRRATLRRVYASLASSPYQMPISARISDRARQVLAEVRAGLQAEHVDADRLLRRVDAAERAEDLSPALAYSARAVIAAHPQVSRFRDAATYVELQAHHALTLSGDERRRQLASVDRHRGVLAFLLGRYEIALDRFAGALAEEHSVENVGNVLATMARLGEVDEGLELLLSMQAHLPDELGVELLKLVESDSDLAMYRRPIPPERASATG